MTPHLNPARTGASAAAVDAYVAAVDALIQFHVSADALESRLEHCREFAVGPARHGITRRERQLVEILLSRVDGDHRRVAALVSEHVSEFADDARPLSIIDRWSLDDQ